MVRGRIAVFMAASLVAVGLGFGAIGHASTARAADVTEVGGGGYGVGMRGPNGLNLTPVPNAVIPPEGGEFYGYSDDKFLPGGIEIGRAVVYAYGNLDGQPYAFVDSRVAHFSVAGIPALTFAGIKTFCEWDQLGADGENQAFGMTFVYYDGAYDWQNHPEIPLATPVPAGTRVDIPGGGYYVLNEQFFETLANGHEVMVVNGLHAFLPDGTEIIAAASSCDPLKPPLLGYTPSADTRAGLAPTTAGVFDPMNNLVISEDCANNVDDNGNDLVDGNDPACQSLPDCHEDGINGLFVVSGDVHYVVEPAVHGTGVVAGESAIHTVNCMVVVPIEEIVEGIVPPMHNGTN